MMNYRNGCAYLPPQNTSRSDQRGSALIGVLFVLLLITVLGAMAMRQSLTTLNISTNAQVRQYLIQAADTPINQFTQLNENPAFFLKMLSQSGILGSAQSNASTMPLGEYVYCYRPTSNLPFGSVLNVAVIEGVPSAAPKFISGNSTNGFCNINSDFGSNRAAAVTQVAVTIPTTATGVGCQTNCGTDQGNGLQTSGSYRVRVTSTSLLPAFSATDLATVQTNCLGSGSNPGKVSDNEDPSLASTQSLTDCLALYGVPASTQVQEYVKSNVYSTVTAPLPN
jgi:hypothetical protein